MKFKIGDIVKKKKSLEGVTDCTPYSCLLNDYREYTVSSVNFNGDKHIICLLGSDFFFDARIFDKVPVEIKIGEIYIVSDKVGDLRDPNYCSDEDNQKELAVYFKDKKYPYVCIEDEITYYAYRYGRLLKKHNPLEISLGNEPCVSKSPDGTNKMKAQDFADLFNVYLTTDIFGSIESWADRPYLIDEIWSFVGNEFTSLDNMEVTNFVETYINHKNFEESLIIPHNKEQ